MGNPVQISIITPAYREEKNLPLLWEKIDQAMKKEAITFEWIIVDDHSPDSTFEVAKRLSEKSLHVRAIRLSKNSGSHLAIRCGLERACGQEAMVMASDLQDDPEWIALLRAKKSEGAKIVWATRSLSEKAAHRPGLFSRLYWWFLSKLSGVKSIPPSGADAFWVDASVLKELKRFHESNVSLFLLLGWMGFKQASVEVEKSKRAHGETGWTFSKKWKLLVDSITSFSSLPIRLIGALGLGTALLGFIYALFIVATAWSTGERPAGWSSLMVGILVLGGAQMLFLSILGEYLWRALEETRGRPLYLVEEDSKKEN